MFKQFRTGFLGKASPVHFFWGSFDLAVTRFSGRRAPRHPGGVPHLPDTIAREAYSHEVSSAGFWPGSGAIDYPAYLFLRLSGAGGLPDDQGETGRRFLQRANSVNSSCPMMPCERLRYPDRALLEFLQSTYEAAAVAARWDRDALECPLAGPA